MSAVLAVARKEIWQGSVGAFNVRLTSPARETDPVGLPTKMWHSADSAVNESAPSRRISVADGDRAAGHKPQESGDRLRQRCIPLPPDPPACSPMEAGIRIIPVRFVPIRFANDTALKPRPALPGGALWR